MLFAFIFNREPLEICLSSILYDVNKIISIYSYRWCSYRTNLRWYQINVSSWYENDMNLLDMNCNELLLYLYSFINYLINILETTILMIYFNHLFLQLWSTTHLLIVIYVFDIMLKFVYVYYTSLFPFNPNFVSRWFPTQRFEHLTY